MVRERCLSIALIVLALGAPRAHAAAPTWIELRSPNFLVQGDVDERQLRNCARRLEEFRDLLSRGLPTGKVSTAAPTVVLVFASNESFDPYRPVYNGKKRSDLAGFFIAGSSRNYLGMLADDEDNSYPIAFHELTHQVVQARLPEAPLWLNEGVAQFYQTYTKINGGKQARIGRPSARVTELLRSGFLPLDQVLSADATSPLYNGPGSELFYAESWALVHYLFIGAPQRTPQMNDFIRRLVAGVPREKAFVEAFGAPVATVEGELRDYIKHWPDRSRVVTLPDTKGLDVSAPIAAMTPAAVDARLGDLLLYMNRPDESETHLRSALKLDAGNVDALVSLAGVSLLRGNRADAVSRLREAVAADPRRVDAFVALGDALVGQIGLLPTADVLEEARGAYERARALQPESAPALSGLAWTLAMMQQRLDEAQRFAERAVALAPDDANRTLVLVFVLGARGDYSAARAMLAPLTAATHGDIRERARKVMVLLAEAERRNGARPPTAPLADTGDGTLLIMRPTKEGEQRAFGHLTRVQCTARETTYLVQTNARTLRLATAHPEAMELISFRQDLKKLECGARDPADPVYITFKPASKDEKNAASRGAQAQAPDGDAVALEFMPLGFVPNAVK